MEPIVLDQFEFQVDFKAVADELRVKPGSKNAGLLQELCNQADEIARPKAIYRIAQVAHLSDDQVQVGEQVFKSRVMRVNLQESHRVFLYVATCGMELEEWIRSLDGTLAQFFADTINGQALMAARSALDVHLSNNYHIEEYATMNPGSLNDWPIEAQVQLFDLLGNPEDSIGVSLLDSCLMVPGQSVSGLLFESKSGYVNCQLCPMEDCPHRQAPFDETLYGQKYQA